MLSAETWSRRTSEQVQWRWSQCKKYFLLDHSPLVWPWFPFRDGSAQSRLHLIALWVERCTAASRSDRLLLWLAGVTWPFRATLLARRVVLSHHRSVSVGVLRQYLGVLKLAIAANVPPIYYYRYRLFERDGRPVSFLYEHEIIPLWRLMNGKLRLSEIDDKYAFACACMESGLPSTGVLAVFRDGYLANRHEGPSLPASDLVVKLVEGSQGIGFEAWHYVPASGWRHGATVLDERGIIEHCCRRSLQGPILLQRRLTDHPSIAGLSQNGLSSVRFITYAPPGESSVILRAALLMPLQGTAASNMSAGGIGCPVDMATGRLGPAVSRDSPGALSHHPVTRERIEGVVLPMWTSACELAREAHRRFAWLPFVGWDIAITSAGPVIIEANSSWGFHTAQIPFGAGLGDTWFPEAYLRSLGRMNTRLPPLLSAIAEAERQSSAQRGGSESVKIL